MNSKISLLLAAIECSTIHSNTALYYDQFPSKITDLRLLFKTIKPAKKNGITSDVTPIDLSVEGTIPHFLNGSLVRNGPGVFEFGNSSYAHAFDPIGALQKITFSEGTVQYAMSHITCSHYNSNRESRKIVRAELGTYGEDDWVTKNEDGSEILDSETVLNNRIEFLSQTGYVTDNTNIQTFLIRDQYLSFSDAAKINVHEPSMFRTIGTIHLEESDNFPAGIECTMHSSHGKFDRVGTFWNVLACQCLPHTEHNQLPFPITCYYPYVILSKSLRPEGSIYQAVEFGEPFFNFDKTDLSIHYFHSLSITDNYLIVPFSSLLWPSLRIVNKTLNAEPLTEAMVWNENLKGEVRIISKLRMRQVERYEVTKSMLLMHLINTYETEDEIVIDAVDTHHGDIMNIYKFNVLRQTGHELRNLYNSLTPISSPVRLTINKWDTTRQIQPVKIFENAANNQDWRMFMKGGVEFPTINTELTSGKKYDDFWACGFGSIFQDRIYHAKLSTMERWVWMVEGYSPSEPVFIPSPNAKAEDDGVIVSLVSPFSDPDLEPFIVVLQANDLRELGRAYLPNSLVPLGFHGQWYQDLL